MNFQAQKERMLASMERIATRLADANLVEEAWSLRGYADYVQGSFDPPPMYAKYYRKGYIQAKRVHTEV